MVTTTNLTDPAAMLPRLMLTLAALDRDDCTASTSACSRSGVKVWRVRPRKLRGIVTTGSSAEVVDALTASGDGACTHMLRQQALTTWSCLRVQRIGDAAYAANML